MIKTVDADVNSILDNSPRVFEGIEFLKREYQINAEPTVEPKSHALGRVPLAIPDAAAAELVLWKLMV